MKNIALVITVLLMVTITSCKKKKLEIPVKEEVFSSSIVQDDYKLHISLPKNYSENNKYPVVFLLDGDWYIDYFSKELNKLITSGEVPPSILIGVGYTDENDLWKKRFRDYTYPKSSNYETPTGQADNFHAFLHQELIPKIEKEYSVDSNKYVLMGHSLSGLNVFYNLFQSTESKFSGYVALSSSIWWENGYSFALEEEMNNTITDLPVKLYIAYGSAESGSLAAYNEEMMTRLKSRNYPNLQLETNVFKGASHRQVSWDGLREGAIFTLN